MLKTHNNKISFNSFDNDIVNNTSKYYTSHDPYNFVEYTGNYYASYEPYEYISYELYVSNYPINYANHEPYDLARNHSKCFINYSSYEHARDHYPSYELCHSKCPINYFSHEPYSKRFIYSNGHEHARDHSIGPINYRNDNFYYRVSLFALLCFSIYIVHYWYEFQWIHYTKNFKILEAITN